MPLRLEIGQIFSVKTDIPVGKTGFGFEVHPILTKVLPDGQNTIRLINGTTCSYQIWVFTSPDKTTINVIKQNGDQEAKTTTTFQGEGPALFQGPQDNLGRGLVFRATRED